MKSYDIITKYNELTNSIKKVMKDINNEFNKQINSLPMKDEKITVTHLLKMEDNSYYSSILKELDKKSYIKHHLRNNLYKVSYVLTHLFVLSNPLSSNSIDFTGNSNNSINFNDDNTINVFGYDEFNFYTEDNFKTYFIKVPLNLLDLSKDNNDSYRTSLTSYVESELLLFTKKIDKILESREEYRLMILEKGQKFKEEEEERKYHYEVEQLKNLIKKYPDIVKENSILG